MKKQDFSIKNIDGEKLKKFFTEGIKGIIFFMFFIVILFIFISKKLLKFYKESKEKTRDVVKAE